jgi:hypothetical protein
MLSYGAVVTDMNSTVPQGVASTFTFDQGSFFNFTSDADVKAGLASELEGYGVVSNVYRPFFSGRYLVTLIPVISMSLADWIGTITTSFYNIGFESASFVEANIGETTSEHPGGVSEISTDILHGTTQVIGDVASSASKILWPIAIVAVIAAFAYFSEKGGNVRSYVDKKLLR